MIAVTLTNWKVIFSRTLGSKLEILPPTIRHEDDCIRIAAELHLGKKRDKIWYRFSQAYEDSLCERSDAFLLAAIFPAMEQGLDIRVHGKVSSTLIENLSHFQDTWNKWHPGRYSKVGIMADELANEPAAGKQEIALMFSGGLDSCHLLWKYCLNETAQPRLKPSAAIFVHGFDIPLEEGEAYESYLPRAREVTESLGVELIRVQTNFRKLVGNWIYSHGLALGSCLQLFSGRFNTGLIASSHAYDSLRLPWGSNPVTDPLMSSERMRIINVGGECSRWQKAGLVAGWPMAIKHIRVCYMREGLGRNCGLCDNCLFTALCFAACGQKIPQILHQGTAREAVASFRSLPLDKITLKRIRELLTFVTQRGIHDAWQEDLKACLDFHHRRHLLPKPIGKLSLWWDNKHRQGTCKPG